MVEGNFVDYVKISIISGNGGRGSTHLRREKFVAKGGPDGGDGGRGGHIILQGDKNLWTLFHFKFKQHFKAEHGKDGGKNRSAGANGKDILINIPLGTVIKDENNKTVCEITEHGQQFTAIKGGKGGRGNWHFKSSVNRTPRYAQPGLSGTECQLTLELKLLADVGLVGFPNVGKSTLLSVITAAKPKIANYEFTTLKPNLGIVKCHDFSTFVMADIPGIIEGASEGKGLGHYFLRHIERNSMLLFLISCEADITVQFHTLLKELEKHNPDLLHKQRLLVITKTDLIDQDLQVEIEKEINHSLKEEQTLFISSLTNTGIITLKDRLWEMLNTLEESHTDG